MKYLQAAWAGLGYPTQSAILRFLRIVAAAMLLAVGGVLTHVLTPERALDNFEFAAGAALIAAGEKLQRELANVRRAKTQTFTAIEADPHP